MDQKEAWNKFKNKYTIGQPISGTIIHKAPYGIFLDIGEEFYCLLEIIQINDLDYNLYTEDKIYKLGETVSGILVSFEDRDKQMRISQKNWKKE